MNRLWLCLLLLLMLSGCARRNYPEGKSGGWHFPLPGAEIISDYGYRNGRSHSGMDLKTVNKDKIYAVYDGEVLFSGQMSGYGNLVRIKHAKGLETYYAHNYKNLVTKGQRVKAGKVIALTGQTGRASTPHLHFEIRVNGKTKDPKLYIDFKKQKRRR